MVLPRVDMLSVLPLELRLRIYSYVFSTEDEGLIVVRATQKGDWAGDMGLPPYAVLLQDPQYDRYRRRCSIRNKWSDPVEDAFHRALRWTAAYQHRLNGNHKAHTDEMISRVIQEYTGQWCHRKQVSSHIQQLRRISSRMPEASDRLTQQIVCAATELREADREDIAETNRILGRIQNASFVLARRNHEKEYAAFALSQRRRKQSHRKIRAPPKRRINQGNIMLNDPANSLFHEISHIASQDDHELLFRPSRSLGSDFFALSFVNHFFRSEILRYIESHLSFDFTNDVVALQSFCMLIKLIHRQHVRHMAIDFVDGHTPYVPGPSTTFGTYLSANLPNLKTVFLTLIPRNPTRSYVWDHRWEWGQQTEDFLSGLGDLKATIILNLRWKEDCDYFENKYVGVRGWRCIRRSEDPGEYGQESV